MTYLLFYLAIGALIMAVAVLRTPYSNNLDQLALTATGGTEVFDKILAAFIAPLFGCLFAVVAWPLVSVWTVQAMWRRRETRIKESSVPQPKVEQTEIHYFHPRINGKIVSGEEWNTARSQRPEVMANSAIKRVMDSAKRSAYKDEC